MSCCAPTATAFLEEKLRNFKRFLLESKGPEADMSLIEGFTSLQQVMPYLNQLVVLNRSDMLGTVVDGICEKLNNNNDDVKAKVRRYLYCFVDVLSAQDENSSSDASKQE